MFCSSVFSLTAPALLRQKHSKFKSCKCTYYSFTTPLLPWASALLSWRTGLDPISPLEPHPSSPFKALVLNQAVFLLTGLYLGRYLGTLFPYNTSYVSSYICKVNLCISPKNSWSISQHWQSEHEFLGRAVLSRHILTSPHHNFSWCLLFQSAL